MPEITNWVKYPNSKWHFVNDVKYPKNDSAISLSDTVNCISIATNSNCWLDVWSHVCTRIHVHQAIQIFWNLSLKSLISIIFWRLKSQKGVCSPQINYPTEAHVALPCFSSIRLFHKLINISHFWTFAFSQHSIVKCPNRLHSVPINRTPVNRTPRYPDRWGFSLSGQSG